MLTLTAQEHTKQLPKPHYMFPTMKYHTILSSEFGVAQEEHVGTATTSIQCLSCSVC